MLLLSSLFLVEYGHRNHQGRIHSTVPSVPSAIQTIGYNPQPQLTYQLQPAMQGLGAMQGQLQGLTGAAAGGYSKFESTL